MHARSPSRSLVSVSLSALAAGVILLGPGLAEAKDSIVKTDGSTQVVDKVVVATYKKVKYLIVGSRQDMPADDVRDLYVIGSDRGIGAAYADLKGGKLRSALTGFKRAMGSRDDRVKPFAAFFYARCLRLVGQFKAAAAAYETFSGMADKEHFYAPRAYYEAAECHRAVADWAKAAAAYKKLDSFGSTWRGKGAYGKAVALLESGKGAEAESAFGAISGGGEVAALAKVGKARAQILQGKVDSALRSLESLAKRGSTPAAARGAAWVGVAEGRMKKGKSREGLIAALRSVLLYGDEGSVSAAKRVAGKAAVAMKAGGLNPRIRGYRGSTYNGKKPDAEFVTQLMRISAGLALDEAKALMKTASGAEAGDLAFLYADALRFTGKTKEYEKAVAEAQKKFPNHPRARDVKVDLMLASLGSAKRKLTKAKESKDEAEAKKLRAEAGATFKTLIKDFQGIVDAARKVCVPLEEIDDFKKKYTSKNVAKMRRRDFLESKQIEVMYEAAKSLDKKNAERTKLLEKALVFVENFTLDRGENFSFDLLANAYKLKGEILLELDRSAEAIEEFQGLKGYEAPFVPQSKKVRAEIATFVKGIRISAYRLLAVACSRAGKPEEAIEAFEEMEKAIPDYKNEMEGLLAMFSLSKCLAGVGRTSEALDQIYPIIKDPRSVKIKGVDPEALKVEACKGLAGISDASGGEIFPPEMQFLVGFGHKANGDDEKAIVGYKGVLTSAVSKEDRKLWVPKAVTEMGTLLYYQGRFLEATLAYMALYKEFPDHPEAQNAIMFARAAMLKALKAFGEDESGSGPLQALKKEIEEALTAGGSGPVAAQLLFKEAAKSQTRRKYSLAAQKYLQVPAEYTDDDGKKKPIKFYANAVANAGYCYFREYQDLAKKKKKASAKEMLGKATKELERALGIAKDKKDNNSLAVASYFLGELYNFEKKHTAALRVLKGFDGKLGSVKRFTVRARNQQIVAYLETGKIDEAEKRYTLVKDRKDDSALAGLIFNMGDWFNSRADKAAKAKKGRAEVLKWRSKAGEYIGIWVSMTKKLRREYLLWAGALCFNGKQFDKAVEIYERLFKEHPRPKLVKLTGSKAQKQAATQSGYDVSELNLAWAYSQSGKLAEAGETFARLQKLALLVTPKTELLRMRGSLVKEERRSLGSGSSAFRTTVFTIKVDGKEMEFMVPRGKGSSIVVEGTKLGKIYDQSDYMLVQQPFRTNYLVLEGLARTTWQNFKKTGDKSYLAKEVQAAWNAYYIYVKKTIDEGRYQELVDEYELAEKDYGVKCLKTTLRLLEIAYEREEFKKIVRDIKGLETLGELKPEYCPPELKKEFDDLLKKSER